MVKNTAREKVRTCTIPGCSRKLRSFGLCSSHKLLRDRGLPMDVLLHHRKGEAADWIVEHATHNGAGCLIWPFPRRGDGTAKGRGSLTFRGVQMDPSRAMCIEAHGYPPLPDDDATHTCGKGNDGCVHPSHLVWGTRQKNMADKILHGTYGVKLSVDDVREIRAANSNERPDDVGQRYGVSGQMVRNIRSRKSWAALE